MVIKQKMKTQNNNKVQEFNLSEEDRKNWKLYSLSMIGLDELKKRLENSKKEFIKRLKGELSKENKDNKKHLKSSLEKGNYSEATLTDNIIYANNRLIKIIDKLAGKKFK